MATMAAACGGTTAPSSDAMAGQYTMVSVDGGPVPGAWVSFGAPPGITRVVGGVLDLRRDGAFTHVLRVEHRAGGVAGLVALNTIVRRGTYRRQGSQVTFSADDAAFPGLVDGGRFVTTYPNDAPFVDLTRDGAGRTVLPPPLGASYRWRRDE
jgi:hypothetical protein